MVGVAQLVEHLVVVQDVAGSSPVTHPKGSRESRAAVLRRSEQARFSFASDDEVVDSTRDAQTPQIKGASVGNRPAC